MAVNDIFPVLPSHTLNHRHVHIFRAILGILPSYLHSLIKPICMGGYWGQCFECAKRLCWISYDFVVGRMCLCRKLESNWVAVCLGGHACKTTFLNRRVLFPDGRLHQHMTYSKSKYIRWRHLSQHVIPHKS